MVDGRFAHCLGISDEAPLNAETDLRSSFADSARERERAAGGMEIKIRPVLSVDQYQLDNLLFLVPQHVVYEFGI